MLADLWDRRAGPVYGRGLIQVTADGAYDGATTYQTIGEHGDEIEVVIPPRSTARQKRRTGCADTAWSPFGDDCGTRPPGLAGHDRLLSTVLRFQTQSAHQIMTAAKATEEAKLRESLS
jgi:hypothetical protein